MDESRKQFVEFAKNNEFFVTMQNGEFLYPATRKAWKIWKQSRAAIEIKLPPAVGEHQMQWDGTDWNQMREHAVNAIRAAGIKVKE